jgi:hypothetical protein
MAKYLQVAKQNGSPLILESIVDQVANAAELYLDGSNLQLPQSEFQPRLGICWQFWMTKTAVGVGAPIINIRSGVNGALTDAIRIGFALGAQTAAVDSAMVEIKAILRVGGAAAILEASLDFDHDLPATGFATQAGRLLVGRSAAFDLSGDNKILGVSVNPVDGVWTIRAVRTEATLT